MAETALTLYPSYKTEVRRWAWLAVPNGNTGAVIEAGEYGERSVQVVGTFGSGGSVSLQGSNDGGTTWVALTDHAGNAVTFTSAGMKQVSMNAALTRCSVTAGDGTTSLNVYLFGRKDRS